MASIDKSGNVFTVRDGNPSPSIFSTRRAWRATAPNSFGERWYGIAHNGTLQYAELQRSLSTDTVRANLPVPGWDQRVVAVVPISPYRFMEDLCVVTTEGSGSCPGNTFFLSGSMLGGPTITHVHALCAPSSGWACFLSIYGDLGCWPLRRLRDTPLRIPAPAEGERWVEIVCGSSIVCARAATGRVRCFSVFVSSTPFMKPPQLSGNYTTLAAYSRIRRTGTDRQRLCGIDTSHKLVCSFASPSSTAQLVTIEPKSSWAAVAVTYESVCAIGFR